MENIFLCYTLPEYFYNLIYRTVAEKPWRKPDLRKTLRWKSLSQTDRDNRLDFLFYNNDHPDKQHGAIDGVAFADRCIPIPANEILSNGRAGLSLIGLPVVIYRGTDMIANHVIHE